MLEQMYILFIYILLFELTFMIVLVVALFVALVITRRKLDSKKVHLCLTVRDAL
ncbi:MAG: hypothetical protein HFJ52_05745 [Clostridia bacterium]|nr:hypothetical protein [Clostridia bacterium]